MSNFELRHAQKIDFVGRIAVGLAHNFNNLLSAMVTVSSLLLTDRDIAEQNRVHIEVLKGAAERASELTRQLLAFSRRKESDARSLNLNSILHDVEPILRRLLGNEIHLVASYLAEPATVMADPTQIDQVIMTSR